MHRVSTTTVIAVKKVASSVKFLGRLILCRHVEAKIEGVSSYFTLICPNQNLGDKQHL